MHNKASATLCIASQLLFNLNLVAYQLLFNLNLVLVPEKKDSFLYLSLQSMQTMISFLFMLI